MFWHIVYNANNVDLAEVWTKSLAYIYVKSMYREFY